jgi:hypothetical protein
MRTTPIRAVTATASAALIVLAGAGTAFAERDDDDGAVFFGSEGLLEDHLEQVHGYTDVACEKIVPVNEPTYTIDPEEFPNPIALRIQGNENGKRLILDPLTDKAYPAPGEDTKINFVIVCTGTASEEPGEPPIETDGPATAPGPDSAVLFGGATLLVGLGAVLVGRRRIHQG